MTDFVEIRWGSVFNIIGSDFPMQIDILKCLHRISQSQIILRQVSGIKYLNQMSINIWPLKGQVLLKALRTFESDSASMDDVITEYEKIVCFGLTSSDNEHEQILRGELA